MCEALSALSFFFKFYLPTNVCLKKASSEALTIVVLSRIEKERQKASVFVVISIQCDQIARFIGLWAIFQSLWQQLICPNFCKVVKIFNFSTEIIFDQLFVDIW